MLAAVAATSGVSGNRGCYAAATKGVTNVSSCEKLSPVKNYSILKFMLQAAKIYCCYWLLCMCAADARSVFDS